MNVHYYAVNLNSRPKVMLQNIVGRNVEGRKNQVRKGDRLIENKEKRKIDVLDVCSIHNLSRYRTYEHKSY